MPPVCFHEHLMQFVDHKIAQEHVPKRSTENCDTEAKLITRKHAKYLPLPHICCPKTAFNN